MNTACSINIKLLSIKENYSKNGIRRNHIEFGVRKLILVFFKYTRQGR